MTRELFQWAFQTGMPCAAKLLLLAMIGMSDDDHAAATPAHLQTITGLSEHAFTASLQHLISHNMIAPAHRPDLCKQPDTLTFRIRPPATIELFSDAAETARTQHASLRKSFDAFWRIYPRAVGKGDAERAYRKHVLAGVAAEEINAGAQRFASATKALGTEQKFIPHPSTWLNGRRWEDRERPPAQPRNDISGIRSVI